MGSSAAPSVCIVIPIHNATPSPFEVISFKQCFTILGKYPIKVVAPKGLNLGEYIRVNKNFEIINIDPHWQSSLESYNKLKLSKFFYKLFKGYEFLLTYELDAFVFRDELSLWCNKGYDYIGAPWFEGYGSSSPQSKLIGVGNSGFSLRRIESVYKAISSIYYKSPEEYKSGYKKLVKAHLKFPYRWIRSQLGENYFIQKNGPFLEDVFISQVIPASFKWFNVAPIEEALKFSFEVHPSYLFKQNNNQLPMGCHAWWRYDLGFWKSFIEEYGHCIESSF